MPPFPSLSLPGLNSSVAGWHGVAAALRLSQEEAGLRPRSQASAPAPAPAPPARAEDTEVDSEQLARAMELSMKVGLGRFCTDESEYDMNLFQSAVVDWPLE
jgi:hypothetical protein